MVEPDTALGTTTVTGESTGTTERQGITTSSSASNSTSGSSTSTTTGGGGPVDQAAFDAKAKELCQTFDAKASSMFGGGGNVTQQQLDDFIAFLRDFEAQLKAIGTPPGKEQAAARFFAVWERYIALFERSAPSLVGLGSDESPPSSLLSEFASLSDELDSAAQAFGLGDCSGST